MTREMELLFAILAESSEGSCKDIVFYIQDCIKDVENNVKQLVAELLDADALHLSDEQSIRNMDKRIAEFEKQLAEADCYENKLRNEMNIMTTQLRDANQKIMQLEQKVRDFQPIIDPATVKLTGQEVSTLKWNRQGAYGGGYWEKIEAIKSIRTRTGLGLKEAKAIVDKFLEDCAPPSV